MRTATLATAIALGICAAMRAQTNSPHAGDNTQTPTAAHVSNTFRFVIDAPLAQAAPLFGPDGERSWAGKHWNPVFLYPRPGKDIQGAVFTVQHGPHTSLWVNTIFDIDKGRMQYVAVIPSVVLTVIDVHLTASEAARTLAEVTYTRTALDPAMNEEVEAMAAADRDNGPDWQRSIATALQQNGHAPRR